MKPLGFANELDGKCYTIFSASNYCNTRNKGAFIVFDLTEEFTTVSASAATAASASSSSSSAAVGGTGTGSSSKLKRHHSNEANENDTDEQQRKLIAERALAINALTSGTVMGCCCGVTEGGPKAEPTSKQEPQM